jgi:hypothetical protein
VLFAYLPAGLKLDLKDTNANNVTIERISAVKLHERLTRLLESPVYTNFVGLDEKKTAFTAEEKALIRQRSETFFAEFEKSILKDLCRKLENAPRDLGLEASGGVGDSDPVARLEQRIIDLAKNVLTAKDETTHIKGKVDKSIVEVVEFRYDHETRLAAAKTLNEKTGSFKGWSVDAKADLNKALKEDVDGALNVSNFKEFKESMLSRSLREWYMRQQEILALLPAPPAKPSPKKE